MKNKIDTRQFISWLGSKVFALLAAIPLLFLSAGVVAANLELVPRQITYDCQVVTGGGQSNRAPTCDQAIQPLLQYYIDQPVDFRGCQIAPPIDPAVTVFGSCYVNGNYPSAVWLQKTNVCPSNSREYSTQNCICESGYSAGVGACHSTQFDPPTCSAADDGLTTLNPIIPASGEKQLYEIDYIDNAPHSLNLRRTYRSQVNANTLAIGSNWLSIFSVSLVTSVAPDGGGIANITTGDGKVRRFKKTFSNVVGVPPIWTSVTITTDTLTETGSGFDYKSTNDESVWRFNTAGRLITQTQRNGWITSYTYLPSGKLSQVTNQFGRTMLLAYNAGGQISQVTQPDGRAVRYDYVTGADNVARLSKVTYPDNTFKTYLYENTAFPGALTGVTDENNVRWATYSYDAQGRAADTQHAGGANRFQVVYPATVGASTQVTDPLGTARNYKYSTALGLLAVDGADRPSGQGMRDAATRVQSALGLIDTETDFAGFITNTTWDTARRLPTAVTRAAATPEAQTVQTQWHPTLRLPTLITEAGRTMAYTYDALGNKLTEVVTDTSVPASTPNAVRTSAWTYNAQGLVATETAPNGAVTRYTYNSAGNPLTSSNALGHTTTFAYAGTDGAAGRVTSMLAPTGLLTSYTYDARGRMLSSVQSAGTSTLASRYTYTPSGQLASASMPSGHQITYTYDAAQRLTGWQDNRGATGVYTLDPMGNRTLEQIKNTAGQVVWQLARSINALNRVASETVGAAAGTINSNLATTYGYNANGSLVSEANGLAQTTQYGLDGLRRVTAITNAANATANLTYNALDAVTSAKDFKGVVTATPRDALGNATSTTSPDAGAQTAQYDALGLPKQIIDALGQATNITRDALGRPTLITYQDGRSTQLRYDLAGAAYNAAGSPNASKGYLGQILDTTDVISYQRDGFGRVVSKSQFLAPFTSGTGKSVQYRYAASTTGQGNGAGQLDRITYPNGGQLSYLYSPAGQITQLNYGANPLVTNIQYTPLGLPASWIWEFGDTSATSALPASRAYDTAGRVVATELGTYAYDSAGRITSLTQQLYKPSNILATSAAFTATTAVYTIGYDTLGRISSFSRAAGTGAASTAPLSAQSATFTYDANGNRLTSVQTTGSGASAKNTLRTYTVDAASNRLLGFAQTLSTGTATGGASANVAYQYDANGALLKDGLRSYEFDAAGRLAAGTTGSGTDAPTTRYVHNALGQRLFKTEPLYPPVVSGSNPADPGVMAALINFFTSLWGGSTTTATPSAAEKLGFQYFYDEEGSLLAEVGTGGANSTGTSLYFYLPTPSGPLPIAAITGGAGYAVHTDHLNTPRRLSNASKQAAWQWAYSAFGDEQPTIGRNRYVDPATTPNAGTTTMADVVFNLRYPGQYFDKESGLSYNYFRSYDSRTGRYSQSDPIGLQGGWNRFAYVEGNPLGKIDPTGELALNGVGGGVAAVVDIAGQLVRNGGNWRCVDLVETGAAALTGAVFPGAVGTYATAWLRGSNVSTNTLFGIGAGAAVRASYSVPPGADGPYSRLSLPIGALIPGGNTCECRR
jgi:RHS repeat-associated protein